MRMIPAQKCHPKVVNKLHLTPLPRFPKVFREAFGAWNRWPGQDGYIHCRATDMPISKSWKDHGMATGKVKWFNPKRGYGFIVPADTGPEVFVHQTAIKGGGYRTLNQGEQVHFEL